VNVGRIHFFCPIFYIYIFTRSISSDSTSWSDACHELFEGQAESWAHNCWEDWEAHSDVEHNIWEVSLLLIRVVVVVWLRDVRSHNILVEHRTQTNVQNCTSQLQHVSTLDTGERLSRLLTELKRIGTIVNKRSKSNEILLHMMVSVIALEDRLT